MCLMVTTRILNTPLTTGNDAGQMNNPAVLLVVFPQTQKRSLTLAVARLLAPDLYSSNLSGIPKSIAIKHSWSNFVSKPAA